MQIQSLLTPGRTVCGVEGESKRQVLEALANVIAKDVPTIDADDLLRRFMARERLGSTGIGHGIAIPHCRTNQCPSAVGALITLKHPVNFDAIDSQPVDILFAMLVPEDAHKEHLENLAALATVLNNNQFRARLRSAETSDELYHASVNQ